MRIDVTETDIALGMCGDSCECPVALAIKRAMPGSEVEVYYNEIAIDGKEIESPTSVLEFVEAFDSMPDIGFDEEYGIVPFSFDLEI